MDLSANVTLEIDTARKRLHADVLRPAEAHQARHRRRDLRPLRARHGRQHHQHARLLGRRDPRDQLLRAGAVRPVPLRQGHAADQHHRRRPRPRRSRCRASAPAAPTSRAPSSSRPAASRSSWSARRGSVRRARPPTWCGCRAASSSASRPSEPGVQAVRHRVELSFGIGDAQLTYGEATGLLIITERRHRGQHHGRRRRRHRPAGHRHPVQGVSGTVTVMFNTTRQDVMFRSPTRSCRCSSPATRRRSRSSARRPASTASRNPSAPAGGEIYIKATINAAAVDRRRHHPQRLHRRSRPPSTRPGAAYFKIDGARRRDRCRCSAR